MRTVGERAGITRERVLRKIEVLTRRHGYPPTFRELGEELGITFGTTNYWLQILRKEGSVTYKPGIARTLSIRKRRGSR